MSYQSKLDHFREVFELQHNARMSRLYPNLPVEKISVDEGYKFDKVYVVHSNGQKAGRYMVESRTGEIFGIKAWTQVNKRRQYGTLDTVDEFDWSDFYARPLPNTEAEKRSVEREAKIKAGQKKRGRKPKSATLVVAGKN